jgi:hypothetical protein
MTERELTHAMQDMLNRYVNPTPDPAQLVAEIIRRDRKRVQLLASLTVFLWLVGVAGLLLMIFWLNRFVIATTPLPAEFNRNVPAATEQEKRQAELSVFSTMRHLHHSLEAAMCSVAALLLAAVCTVLLVFSVRRATLTQINLSLMTISAQLKELRPDSARTTG